LEKRLGESFKLVSDRLEAVQRGLGEMKSLADGVGDLKRVLTNVKERGTWGEYQLGAILEQILTPEQYEARFHPKEGAEQVEYAVRLPGRGGPGDEPVWLPIDAKFPKEDYERLIEASAAGDADGVKRATSSLAGSIEKCAKDIRDKYINPPRTTDFAIMFLPTEGLYAEVLRHPGLQDTLQQKYHVLPTGPTTLAAILNSLRVGFHTLAIEKRSSEVWEVLAAVKAEFGKFGEVLAKVQGHLNMASQTLDKTAVRTRVMERKLRMVHEMPTGEAGKVLELAGPDVPEED
jgi:DNA recombination protein RmuC